MGAWVNRTVLSGGSIAANGTNSHTCTFTPATSGNLLVAIVDGAVTFTTPSGWTLRQSAVQNAGLYVFTKVASAAEASFSTTHNGSNYPIHGVVYEYYAGSTFLSGSSATIQSVNSNQTGPAVSSLTGTYTRFTARSVALGSSLATASCAWTTPSISDYDAYTPHGATDGVALTIAYDDGQTASSFTPSSTYTLTSNGNSAEAVAFALSVTTPPTGPVAVNIYNTAEGGSNGSGITTGNTGGASGTAISNITTNTGSIVFDNSLANSGTYSYLFSPNGATTCKFAYSFSGSGSSTVTTRAYFYFTSAPSVATQLLYFSNVTPAIMGVLGFNATGKFITQDNTGTINTGLANAPLNTWLRLEISVQPGVTGTGDGYINSSVYVGHSVTNQIYSYTTSTATTLTTEPTVCQFGKVSAAGTWAPFSIDNLAIQDVASIGPIPVYAPVAWVKYP